MDEKLWSVRPNPIADETFTSWICRLALRKGLPPRNFFVQTLGWRDSWDKDLDQFDDIEKMVFLSTKAGKDLESLKKMILDDSRFVVNSSGFASSQEFFLYCP